MSYAFNFALLWACLWNMIIKWTLCDILFWKQPQLSWRLALKRMHLRSVNYWPAQLIIKFNKKQSTHKPRVNQEGPLGDPGRLLDDHWWPLGDPQRPWMTHDNHWVAHDNPCVTQHEPWVTQSDPLITPLMILGDSWVSQGDKGWQGVTPGWPRLIPSSPLVKPFLTKAEVKQGH